MKAVVIGPGRIGCGFVGQLLHQSGYEIVFVARNAKLVEHFNRVGEYRVLIASKDERHEISVGPVRALWAGDTEAVAEAIAEADIVATAVGPQNLPAIAPLIAAGLAKRRTPVNVLAFENLINAGPCLRRLVRKAQVNTDTYVQHGFSGCLVHRVVTQRLGELDNQTPLLFVGDPPEEFVAHGPSLRAPLPKIQGMMLADNYAVWVLRKLYTFSAGHATAAYLGALKGYHYIHSAVRDPEIRESVLAAMAEGQKGLAARFGTEVAGDEAQLLHILERFENAALNDPIQRVGRDPRRKLGVNERLVGAARMADRAGIRPEKLSLAAAAAFCFCNPADPSCNELQRCISDSGVAGALNQVCGLDPQSGVARFVARSWEQLVAGWQPGNLLLSLDRRVWAWSASPQ